MKTTKNISQEQFDAINNASGICNKVELIIKLSRVESAKYINDFLIDNNKKRIAVYWGDDEFFGIELLTVN